MNREDVKRIIVLSCLDAAVRIATKEELRDEDRFMKVWDHLIAETEKRVEG